MRAFKLNNGETMPAIGLGVYLLDNDTALGFVKKALEAGYRLIDSAAYYRNEETVAKGVYDFLRANPSCKREEIMYTTKLNFNAYSYEKAKRAIQQSMDKVEKYIGHIDLMLIHAPLASPKDRLGTWKALQEAVDAGQIKSIGVSNYGIHHIQEILQWPETRILPTVNQIELNPWMQQRDIIKFCKEQGIVVQAFSPLMTGMRLDHPELVSLARKYNKSVAQILLRWVVQQGVVPLPKTANESRLISNMQVFDWELSKEDQETLGDPNERFLTIPGWDPPRDT